MILEAFGDAYWCKRHLSLSSSCCGWRVGLKCALRDHCRLHQQSLKLPLKNTKSSMRRYPPTTHRYVPVHRPHLGPHTCLLSDCSEHPPLFCSVRPQVSESGKALLDVLQRSSPSESDESTTKPDFTAATHTIMGVLHQEMQVRLLRRGLSSDGASELSVRQRSSCGDSRFCAGSPRGRGSLAAPEATAPPASTALRVSTGR